MDQPQISQLLDRAEQPFEAYEALPTEPQTADQQEPLIRSRCGKGCCSANRLSCIVLDAS